jgi:hypothetical protein
MLTPKCVNIIKSAPRISCLPGCFESVPLLRNFCAPVYMEKVGMSRTDNNVALGFSTIRNWDDKIRLFSKANLASKFYDPLIARSLAKVS